MFKSSLEPALLCVYAGCVIWWYRKHHDSFQTFCLALFGFSSLWSLSLQQIAYFPALLTWAWAGTRRGFVWYPTRTDGPLLGLVIVTILSSFLGTDPQNSLAGLPKTLGWMGVLIWTVHAVNTRRQIRWAAVGLLVSAATQAIFGLVAYKRWPLRYDEVGGWDGWRRIFGTMSHPIFLGEGLAMVLVFGLVWVLWAEERRKWVWGLLSLPVMACLGLTYARGAWIGFILGMIVLGAFVSRKILVLLLVMGMIGLGGMKMYPNHPLVARVKSMGSTQNETVRERLAMWKVGLVMAKRHPLGIGVDNARRTQEIDGLVPLGHQPYSVLHSNLVQVLVDRGVLGLLFFCWWSMLVVKELLGTGMRLGDPTLKAMAVGAGAAFVVFWGSGLTEYDYGTARIVLLMWFMVGLGFASIRLDRLGVKD